MLVYSAIQPLKKFLNNKWEFKAVHLILSSMSISLKSCSSTGGEFSQVSPKHPVQAGVH